MPRETKKKVLMLLTETFANGGIQRFNRTLLAACGHLDVSCDVYSLDDTDRSVQGKAVGPDISVRPFARNKVSYVLATLGALWSGRYDIVIIGHVHLLELVAGALTVKPWRRPRALMIAHGVEVWTGIKGLRRRSLRRVQEILCVSDFTRAMIREQAPELGGGCFTIFPNALGETWNGKLEPPLAETNDTGSEALPARFILSVARLERPDRNKGILSAIESLSMLADRSLHYIVAGRGGDMDFLRSVAQRFGVSERVHFPGAVSDRELVNLYRRCEAFVLPSGQEGFGIVFLEAMFFGAPVIAAREKGAVDVVQDGETGLLVGFGDTIALKLAMERMLTDVSLRERLRVRGRAAVTDRGAFTFNAFVERCATALGVAHERALLE